MKKTFKFFFDKFTCMLSGFLAIFYSEAIQPDLFNNNTNVNAMCKDLYTVPLWKDLPRKKVAVSFLTIPSKSDIKIFHMYVSTCQHVSLCEHKCPQVLSPPTHSVTLDKSLSLSWSQSPLLLKAVALIYYFHAYLEKYIPIYSIP